MCSLYLVYYVSTFVLWMGAFKPTKPIFNSHFDTNLAAILDLAAIVDLAAILGQSHISKWVLQSMLVHLEW